jgi:hypothetical protein
VQGHPHLEPIKGSPIFSLERALCHKGRRQCAWCADKDRADGIPHSLEHTPVVGGDCLLQDGVVASKCSGHGLLVLLPQLGAAGDVCE